MPETRFTRVLSLDKLCGLLPSPLRPLHGKRAAPLALPDNIICFCRRSATDLNRPQRGRALHHRYVLILALETAVTVAVDDRAIRLNPDEGLLVLPFQFHHYLRQDREELLWLFITFDMIDAAWLQALRFRPFVITPEVRQTGSELVEAYLTRGEGDLASLLLAVLLQRIRQAEPIVRRHQKPSLAPGLIMRVNQLAQDSGQALSAKEIAMSLGISASHLRARFRASCGVSLGRHLRRLRLEKACGLLRLSQRRVTEIAELCSFASIYSFSRAFRTAYGVSPMAYRHGGRAARPGG
ncbi:MAG TPA: helix-turn-helix transcriptional regulator [Opitutaceae bacterium]|nr:helix-turn-helix transcriptional regulator [Opitutaceae bacterium]